MPIPITLAFGDFSLDATLFDTVIAQKLAAALPIEIPLTYWGDEAYGPAGILLGEEAPQATIPPGGIAWTDRGGYLCLFFGQVPAWPVEYVGRIEDEGSKRLAAERPGRVTLRRA